MKRLPVGVTNFKKIIEGDYYYVDKTDLIRAILDSGAEVTLFTRPRRFGKTLNMSMLAHFFDCRSDNTALFKNLKVGSSEYFSLCGKYPVIFLTLKDVKKKTWEECYELLKNIIKDLFNTYHFVRDKLNEVDRIDFDKILFMKDGANFDFSLKYLSRYLHQYYGKKAVILIDEYDTPILAANENGYYSKAISFVRELFGGSLKDNDDLQIGVMTGILRVAKEGIFSGLNNPDVSTILDGEYEEYFGLTEVEVETALDYYKLYDSLPDVKEWYNGYLFGDKEIYNPWSILNFLNRKTLEAYWVNTSSNIEIDRILTIADTDIFSEMLALFNGEGAEHHIDKNMAFDGISDQKNLWALLFFSGYLTVKENLGDGYYLLKIPNREIYTFFKKTFVSKYTDDERRINRLMSALHREQITGQDSFESNLQKILLYNVSYYDITDRESFLHVFMLGLAIGLDGAYTCISNRESGLGRPDILLIPRDKKRTGYVFELKTAESVDKFDQKLEEAINQMVNKKYNAYFVETDIRNVMGIGIVFCGKELKVRSVAL